MDTWSETEKVWWQVGLTAAFGFAILLILMRGLDGVGKKFQLSKLALSPLRFVLKWVGILIIIGSCLQPFEVNIVAYIASVLGLVAVGFVAAWSLLSNLSCTFLLILLKPFQVDDVIEFTGEEVRGRVVDLNLFFTTLKAEDGDEIKIPNNQFLQKILRKKAGNGAVSLAEQLYEDTPAK